MKKHHSILAIEKMCKVFKVSKSGYYYWLSRKPSARQLDEQQALKLIKEIHQASKSRWTRCSATCRSMVVQKSLMNLRKKVFLYLDQEWPDGPNAQACGRSMRKASIRSIIHKRFGICTTDSKHNYPVAKNLLNRNFTPENIGKAWVSDPDLRQSLHLGPLI